jgi:phosphoribosylaminoimidazole-succinocarboxamide synthase
MTSDALRRAAISAALPSAVAGLDDTTFAPTHRGKVRDVYVKGQELLLVATDRVSAFDVVLGSIPLKGQLLTEQSAFWLEKAATVGKTHLVERVDAAILRCKRAEAFPVELVVRGYLAGSLAREPAETRGRAYGVVIDPALPQFHPFPTPIITPTTKEAVGVHDEPCSLADLVAAGRLQARHVDEVCRLALELFALGQAHAQQQGLILVDTKYEFGLIDGEVAIIDEVHTADSSRFWVASTWAERLAAGQPPEMLDKENLRRWLLAQGYSGHGTPPVLSDEVRIDLAAHYWDLTERVLGVAFSPTAGGAARLQAAVARFQNGTTATS